MLGEGRGEDKVFLVGHACSSFFQIFQRIITPLRLKCYLNLDLRHFEIIQEKL